ncbi:DEAD/DEAH box helicase [Facklamia lactis]|nr:DEAD/DEAH box helicase [Facklamia lactis]
MKKKEKVCVRCGTQDPEHFVQLPDDKGEKNFYCVNCIQLGRVTTFQFLYYLDEDKRAGNQRSPSLMTWRGVLSSEQKRACQEVLDQMADIQRPHLIHAVTGAGKTEIIFPIIDACLQRGGRVCIASPRVDVCLELAPRIQKAFKTIPVCVLHGQSKEKYFRTEITIATTHQLLRFQSAFDLMVIDEVDAFPYKDDKSLHFAVSRAVKERGKLLFLTATPDKTLEEAIKNGKIIRTTLPARFHGYPLPEPTLYWIGNWRKAIIERNIKSRLWQLIKMFKRLPGIKLIFLPDISLLKKLFLWMDHRYPNDKIASVYSTDPERHYKISQVRKGSIDIIISTTILERGVTFENCHVLIIGAEDNYFKKSVLIQMSGRVGRSKNFPCGKLIYAHYGISISMRQANKEIRNLNKMADRMGLLRRFSNG